MRNPNVKETYKIELGDILFWRISRFVTWSLFAILGIVSLGVIFTGKSIETTELIILLAELVIIVIGVIIEYGTRFRRTYDTNYGIVDGKFMLKNSKCDIAVPFYKIKELGIKEIRYGGRSLEVVGWRIRFQIDEKKYRLDSKIVIYEEESKQQRIKQDIHQLHYVMKGYGYEQKSNVGKVSG